jgi:hypothetical protein
VTQRVDFSEDGSRTKYLALIGQPILIYSADRASRALAVARADLNLVGIAMRAEREVIDKIVDGLKFHSQVRPRLHPSVISGLFDSDQRLRRVGSIVCF